MGRPPKKTEENKERLRELKAQRIRDSRERIPIEGKQPAETDYHSIMGILWTNA